jgi:hypothetical protein
MNGKIASKKLEKITVLKVEFQRGFMNGLNDTKVELDEQLDTLNKKLS